jgi:hypothetical protein
MASFIYSHQAHALAVPGVGGSQPNEQRTGNNCVTHVHMKRLVVIYWDKAVIKLTCTVVKPLPVLGASCTWLLTGTP